MIIMGFDASLTCSGFSIHIDGKGCAAQITGTIPVNKLKGTQRLLYVRRQFATLIEQHQPELIVYEDYSMGSKGKTFHIGELGGVLKLYALESGVSLLLVPPTNLKQFTTGKGNAGKPEMVAAVEELWGAVTRSDDEADAYALAEFGKAYKNRRVARKYTQHQRAALEKAIYQEAIILQTIAKQSGRA